jgi:mono/diheme cytochrome c family protein
MPKGTVCTLGALLVSASLAVAEPALGQAELIAQGEQLFEQDCAVCHQPDGTGAPPAFPALAGNENLQDLSRIVQNIHQGEGNMPPFPNLTAEQIAALATYIRNSWGNAFGEVATEEVAAILGGLESAGEQASIWDGVYTAEQAARGEEAYSACTRCHGRRLTGAADDPDMRATPPLARASFLRNWDGRTLATLFEYTKATMPQINPGSLSDQAYIDVIAYMLSASEAPAGDVELAPDPASLGRIVIENR